MTTDSRDIAELYNQVVEAYCNIGKQKLFAEVPKMNDFLYEMFMIVEIKGIDYSVIDRWVTEDGTKLYKLEAQDGVRKLRSEEELTDLVKYSWNMPNCSLKGHRFVDTGGLVTWCKDCNVDGAWSRDSNSYVIK